MHQLLTPQEIETAARQAGLSMAEVCRRADIAPSTFTRWKRGATEPTIGVYRRLIKVVQPTPDTVAPPSAEAAA